MKIVIVTKTNSFILNSIEYQKGALSVNHGFSNGISIGNQYADLADIKCDGETFNNIDDLRNWVHDNLFKSGGGSGSGAVTTDQVFPATNYNAVLVKKANENQVEPVRFIANTGMNPNSSTEIPSSLSIADYVSFRIPYIASVSYVGTGSESDTVTLSTGAPGFGAGAVIMVCPASVDAWAYPPVSSPVYNNISGDITFKLSEVISSKIYTYTIIIKR